MLKAVLMAGAHHNWECACCSENNFRLYKTGQGGKWIVELLFTYLQRSKRKSGLVRPRVALKFRLCTQQGVARTAVTFALLYLPCHFVDFVLISILHMYVERWMYGYSLFRDWPCCVGIFHLMKLCYDILSSFYWFELSGLYRWSPESAHPLFWGWLLHE